MDKYGQESEIIKAYNREFGSASYSTHRCKKDSWVQWAIIILRAFFWDNGEIKSSEPKHINDTG